MTDLKKAAQQALEALEDFHFAARFDQPLAQYAIDALRAALAQQAEPVEPVATVAARQYDDGTYAGNALDWAGRNCEDDFPVGTKLYTSPPQRKPLTEKDLRKLADKHLFYQLESYEASGVFALSRAVERAHGIKE